jgi:hypothetical protein
MPLVGTPIHYVLSACGIVCPESKFLYCIMPTLISGSAFLYPREENI